MLEHLHMLGKAYVSQPPMSAEEGEIWLKELVEAVGMELLLGPYAINCDVVGNEGVTGIVCLTTSHASFHCWHMAERPFMTFDIYSCREFDSSTVLEHLNRFSPTEVVYSVYDRREEVVEIERDRVFY